MTSSQVYYNPYPAGGKPVHTQVPNQYFDFLMRFLSEGGKTVADVLMRKIYGYRENRDSGNQDSVSLSQLIEMGGITENTAKSGVKELEYFGFVQILKQGGGRISTRYRLNDEFSFDEYCLKLILDDIDRDNGQRILKKKSEKILASMIARMEELILKNMKANKAINIKSVELLRAYETLTPSKFEALKVLNEKKLVPRGAKFDTQPHQNLMPSGANSDTQPHQNLIPQKIYSKEKPKINKTQKPKLAKTDNIKTQPKAEVCVELDFFSSKGWPKEKLLPLRNKLVEIFAEYPAEELEAALDICSSRGKLGELNYLSGVLKNRARDKLTSPSPLPKQDSWLSKLPDKLSRWVSGLKQEYEYNKTIYYVVKDSNFPVEDFIEFASAQGVSIKILRKTQNET